MQTHRASDPFASWFDALYTRHTAQLTFAEIRRALQALSTVYVQRRDRLAAGSVFSGAGKRAAFALFYTPLHFLAVRNVLQALEIGSAQRVVDLGCGTGAAAAAWGLGVDPRPALHGVDINAWALDEARWNWQALGLRGQTDRGGVTRVRLGAANEAVVAAYTVNELPEGSRQSLLPRLLAAAQAGSRVVIVEPIARSISPWWDSWESAFTQAGGRSDTWRFAARLPEKLALLSRAAGLDHRELKARSLAL